MKRRVRNLRRLASVCVGICCDRPLSGGGAKFLRAYRLRHLPSSAYLTVAHDALKGPRLQLGRGAAPADSTFVLQPLDSDTWTLTSQTPFHLKHKATGLYVKRPQTALPTFGTTRASTNDTPFPLRLSKHLDDDDVFSIHVPSAADLEEVARSAPPALPLVEAGWAGRQGVGGAGGQSQGRTEGLTGRTRAYERRRASLKGRDSFFC